MVRVMACGVCACGHQGRLLSGVGDVCFAGTRRVRGYADAEGFVGLREDAQRAIERLDGYGYDNLILRVELAAPRPER